MNANAHVDKSQNHTVRYFGNPFFLARDLARLTGNQFVTFLACYDMTEQDSRGGLKRMKKIGNPFITTGLFKVSRSSVSVNFDYEAKRDARDGKQPETVGNWMTAVIVENAITPLAVHKDDVVTILCPDGTQGAKVDSDGKIIDCIQNHRAVLDASGSIQFTTDTPRLYVRYEIQRAAGEEPRAERKMRSESHYFDGSGVEVDKASVEPYLKKRPVRKDETDFQVTPLDNVEELHAAGVFYRKLHSHAIVKQFLTVGV